MRFQASKHHAYTAISGTACIRTLLVSRRSYKTFPSASLCPIYSSANQPSLVGVTCHGLPGMTTPSLGHHGHSLGSGITHSPWTLLRSPRLLQLAVSWTATHGGRLAEVSWVQPHKAKPHTRQLSAPAFHFPPPAPLPSLRLCHHCPPRTAILKCKLDLVIPLQKPATLLTPRESPIWLSPGQACTLTPWLERSGLSRIPEPSKAQQAWPAGCCPLWSPV